MMQDILRESKKGEKSGFSLFVKCKMSFESKLVEFEVNCIYIYILCLMIILAFCNSARQRGPLIMTIIKLIT